MFFMHDVSNLYKAAAPCPQSISVHFNFWFAIAVHREFPQKICTHKVNIRAYPSFFGAYYHSCPDCQFPSSVVHVVYEFTVMQLAKGSLPCSKLEIVRVQLLRCAYGVLFV